MKTLFGVYLNSSYRKPFRESGARVSLTTALSVLVWAWVRAAHAVKIKFGFLLSSFGTSGFDVFWLCFPLLPRRASLPVNKAQLTAPAGVNQSQELWESERLAGFSAGPRRASDTDEPFLLTRPRSEDWIIDQGLLSSDADQTPASPEAILSL